MRIDNDYSMYYQDTYVGLPLNSGTYPFFVEAVEFSDDALSQCEEDGVDPEEYFEYLYEEPEAAADVLVFMGYYFDGRGESHRMVVPMDELDLENPTLGYVKDGDTWKWYTYTVNQSVKKGLCPRRLNIHEPLSGTLLYKLFNIKPSGNLLDRDLLLEDSGLSYKGIRIAERDGDTLSLDNRFGIMTSYIERLLPEGVNLETSSN